MAKKEPVNLTVQTIYIFIPILSLFALYRIEKLRLGILISILFSIVSWGIDQFLHLSHSGMLVIPISFLSISVSINSIPEVWHL